MNDFRHEHYSKPKSFRLLSPDQNKPDRIYLMPIIEHAKKKYWRMTTIWQLMVKSWMALIVYTANIIEHVAALAAQAKSTQQFFRDRMVCAS